MLLWFHCQAISNLASIPMAVANQGTAVFIFVLTEADASVFTFTPLRQLVVSFVYWYNYEKMQIGVLYM